MNRAVFLDRDGTIAKDVLYCSRPEDFELLPTVGEGIRILNEAGFNVIVEDFEKASNWLANGGTN